MTLKARLLALLDAILHSIAPSSMVAFPRSPSDLT